jgi:DNA repair exonuclease SbcCD ATPase subunit
MHNHNRGEVEEVAALQGAIEAKDLKLQEREAQFDALEKRLNGAINDLRGHLTEKEILLDQRESDYQQAKTMVTQILEQKIQLETLQKQTERLLSAQAEQIRSGIRAELEALEKQLTATRSELQSCEDCAKGAELSHGAELMQLQARLAEMQLISETRNVQIADLKNQNARLQAELTQKQAALNEGETALKRLEQGFRAKIKELEDQLTQKKPSVEHPVQDFIIGDDWPEQPLDGTWHLQERADADCIESLQPRSDHQSRKWRNSGDWKRRWRSR